MTLIKKIIAALLYLIFFILNKSNAQINNQQNNLLKNLTVSPTPSIANTLNDNLYLLANWQIQNQIQSLVFTNENCLQQMQLQTFEKICNLRLQNTEKEINIFSPSVLKQQFYFQQAYAFFKNHNYLDAIETYKKVNTSALTNLQIVEKNFNLAYSYLSTNQEAEVIPLMASVVDIKGNYFESGNYYYGLLKFYNKDYAAAEESFEKIKNHKEYKKVIPYYLVAINYFDNKKDLALQQALDYLQDEKSNIYFKDELNLLAGQIYFENKNYTSAIPFIDNYIADATNIRREDMFMLGYANYEIGNIAKAQDVLSRVTDELDTLSQMTNYVLGDCFLKLNKKEDAKDAFQKVLNIDGISKLNEISRFQFARLSFEINNDNDALNAAYNLIQKFPNSQFRLQCLQIIGNLLKTTTNYDASMKLLKEFNTEPQIKNAYQQIAYNKAMQLIVNKDYNNALKMIQESLDNSNGNNQLQNNCNFWKSEIYYHQNNYEKSLEYINKFLSAKDSFNKADDYVNNAYLLKTYIAIKQGQDSLAAENLNKILLSKNSNYLNDNATELNKINNTLQNYKQQKITLSNLINNYSEIVEANGKLTTNQLLIIDSLQKNNIENKNSFEEINAINNYNNAKYDDALQILQTLTNKNTKDIFYIIQSNAALKKNSNANEIAHNALLVIDTNNLYQAKIITQQFDEAITNKNIPKAETYLELLKKYVNFEYANVRIPIKTKLLQKTKNTISKEVLKPIEQKIIIPLEKNNKIVDDKILLRIKNIENLVELKSKIADKKILELDTLKPTNEIQKNLILETKAIYNFNNNKYLEALQILQTINKTNNTKQKYYAYQCATNLKNYDFASKIAQDALQPIDSTNEFQAKIVVLIFDEAITNLDILKAEKYLEVLKKYATIPYANVRVPIKTKLLEKTKLKIENEKK